MKPKILYLIFIVSMIFGCKSQKYNFNDRIVLKEKKIVNEEKVKKESQNEISFSETNISKTCEKFENKKTDSTITLHHAQHTSILPSKKSFVKLYPKISEKLKTSHHPKKSIKNYSKKIVQSENTDWLETLLWILVILLFLIGLYFLLGWKVLLTVLLVIIGIIILFYLVIYLPIKILNLLFEELFY